MTKIQLNATNIRATEQLYVAAMLEELQLFNVMDRLVTLFQAGLLPVQSYASGSKLFKYWMQQSQRLTPNDRRNLYTRVLGIPGGDASSVPNREFDELWLRFIASVSSVADQTAIQDPAERRVRQEEVRQAGRDLATNLSLHGSGFTYFAAGNLQSQIKTISNLLSASDVRSAYAARSMWEVIDKVSSYDLGGPRNITRYRTMAESGSNIISWLVRKASDLVRESGRPILANQDRRLVEA